jgi:hypothetical protein
MSRVNQRIDFQLKQGLITEQQAKDMKKALMATSRPSAQSQPRQGMQAACR